MDYDDDEYRDGDEYHDTVISELQGIHATLKSRTDFGWIIWAFVVVFFIVSWDGSWADRWTDKLWYSFKHGADFKNITIDRRPSDCDWLRAPIGIKDCQYKKATSVFGAEQRRQAVDHATTPEEKRQYEQMPNSVTVYWEKKSE